MLATVPSCGATTGVSIFIISNTKIGSPFFTCLPTADSSLNTLPAAPASILMLPAAPDAFGAAVAGAEAAALGAGAAAVIQFVGGIRGLDELERRCSGAGDCVCAFAMYPTSIRELFAVADAGLLMPPKSTWFEPKLRSGLFVHEI